MLINKHFDFFRFGLNRFIHQNGWVLLAFLVGFAVIFVSGRGNLAEMSIIFTFHCLADIFVIMMVEAYGSKRFRRGAIYQVLTSVVFLMLKLYTGLIYGHWHYLAADLIFILAAFSSYRRHVSGRPHVWINPLSMGVLAMMIVLFIYLPNGLIVGHSQWFQTIGLLTLSVGLSETKRMSLNFALSLLGVLLIVSGSLWETVVGFQKGQLPGLAFSMFILSMTVLVFFTKNALSVFVRLFSNSQARDS